MSELNPLNYANDAPDMEARAVVLTSAMWRLVESHAAHMGLHQDTAVMHLLHLGFSRHMERKRRQGL